MNRPGILLGTLVVAIGLVGIAQAAASESPAASKPPAAIPKPPAATPQLPSKNPKATAPRKALLRDGHVVLGLRGQIRHSKDDNRWLFVAPEPITDGRGTIPPNAPIELLPSKALEKMGGLLDEKRDTASVWITARVTLYRGANYLYVVYFVPMRSLGTDRTNHTETDAGRADQSESANPETPGAVPTPSTDPNMPSILPDHIRRRLRPDVVLDLEKLPKMLETDRDVAIVDRTGYFTGTTGKRTFVLDGFGRRIEGLRFHVLPDVSLQQTETILDAWPGRMRFRVSGIVTRYNDEYYLLLQRAVRTYTHGNFR